MTPELDTKANLLVFPAPVQAERIEQQMVMRMWLAPFARYTPAPVMDGPVADMPGAWYIVNEYTAPAFNEADLGGAIEAAASRKGMHLRVDEAYGVDLRTAMTQLGRLYGQERFVSDLLEATDDDESLGSDQVIELAMRFSRGIGSSPSTTGLRAAIVQANTVYGPLHQFLSCEGDGDVMTETFSPQAFLDRALENFLNRVRDGDRQVDSIPAEQGREQVARCAFERPGGS